MLCIEENSTQSPRSIWVIISLKRFSIFTSCHRYQLPTWLAYYTGYTSHHTWHHFIDKQNVVQEDRVLIKVEKGYGAKRIMTEFLGRNWSLDSVKRLLHQVDNWQQLQSAVFVNQIFSWFYLEYNFCLTLECILPKRHTTVLHTSGYPYVKLYLIWWSFSRGIAKSLGSHFFLDTV